MEKIKSVETIEVEIVKIYLIVFTKKMRPSQSVYPSNPKINFLQLIYGIISEKLNKPA